MKVRGRPILGAISGFFLGLFVGLDLFLFGLVDSESVLITVLPLVGLVLGIALAVWAPIRGREGESSTVAAGATGSDEPA